MRHKEGHWVLLESTASVVRDGNGQVQKLVIVNRDITERQQLAQQLQMAQKVEAIGRLSGGIAHDFNNILGVIVGYTEALQRRMQPDNTFRDPIDEIQRAAKRPLHSPSSFWHSAGTRSSSQRFWTSTRLFATWKRCWAA